MRGLGYLVPALNEGTLEAFRAVGGPSPFLWITTLSSPAAPADAKVLRLEESPEDGAVDLRRPHDLRRLVAAFLSGRDGGVVVVDCIGAISSQNGIERAVRALQDLHEEAASRNAILVVLLDSRSANPRMVAWLEREFEVLPGAVADRALVGGLST